LGAAGSGTGTGGAASAAGDNGGGGGGGSDRDNGPVAAFVASPVFARVTPTVPTTITASPVVVSTLGVPCQTITQTIDIGGQDVHASAVVCRQPNGGWQIVPMGSAQMGNRMPMPIETSSLPPPAIDK
jgi:hypothetical protein